MSFLYFIAATELDQRERGILAYAANRSTAVSQNYNDQGDFSVEVLRTALAGVGIALEYVSQSNVEVCGLFKETGFIINRNSHWLALRKVGRHFYNLDSLIPKPEVLSEFHLEFILIF